MCSPFPFVLASKSTTALVWESLVVHHSNCEGTTKATDTALG